MQAGMKEKDMSILHKIHVEFSARRGSLVVFFSSVSLS